MPVARLVVGGETHGPRQVFAPKEASLRGWWNSVRKAFPNLELLPLRDMGHVKGHVDEDVITFTWRNGDVWIARKRNMR